jgi:hypothetical protein
MRQRPADVPENEEIADFLNELFYAFGAELNAILERNPNEFHRGSAQIADVLNVATIALSRRRGNFEDRLKRVLMHDEDVLDEIKEWAKFLHVLNRNLRVAECVDFITDVNENLRRLDEEVYAWRMMVLPTTTTTLTSAIFRPQTMSTVAYLD